ncbi:MAG: glycosyltransferase family 2 protein [Thermoplasmata archaeon]|nr:glycosyltransferase family 2 protein [Thermoplasmata archaeon]
MPTIPSVPEAPASPPGGPHLVLLPTLNEEGGIRATLREYRTRAIFAGGVQPPILVIDGGSTDATVEIARESGCHVLRQTGRGKGAAIRDGLAWAVEHGFRTVGVLDADATYPTERLPALFRLLEEGFDLVIGVRRPDHAARSTQRTFVHRAGNGLLGFCAARSGRGPILDVCSGFWGLRTEVVASLGLESTGFEIESEIFVKSFRQHLRVCQIPVTYRVRVGVAKLHAVRDGARILLSILRHSGWRGDRSIPPDPAGWIRPRPSSTNRDPLGVTLPALAAILLTLDPGLLVVTSSSRRRREAAGLVRALPPGPYSVQLDVWDGGRPDGATVPPVWANATNFRSHRPVIVSLPDATHPTGSLPDVTVSVPGQPWVVSLGGAASPAEGRSAGRQASLSGEPATSRQPLIPRPSSWTILGAALDSSWGRKERAVLGANADAVGASIRPRLTVSTGWDPESLGGRTPPPFRASPSNSQR